MNELNPNVCRLQLDSLNKRGGRAHLERGYDMLRSDSLL
jgi:hypothetical protein